MKYLLDTSTLARILRRRGHKNIAARLKQVPPGDAAICSIVRLELLHGAHRQRDAQTAVPALETYLADFTSIPLDDAVADHGGRIRANLAAAGTPIGPYDLLIAATAAAYNLTVVTCNSAEFVRIPGLAVEDWQKG